MSKTPPNLANLPPDVQAFVAAQAAELARKDAEMLGLSLSHANAQKCLKDEKASAEAVEMLTPLSRTDGRGHRCCTLSKPYST